MNRFGYRMFKSAAMIWCVWSSLLTSYELIRMKIPETVYLYEEEAMDVLAGSDTKIAPEKLYLDFAGEVELHEKMIGSYTAVCNLFGMIPLKTMEVSIVPKQELIPGGIPVGVYVQTEGVFVIGTGNIETENKLLESPAKNILKTGDYITSIQGVKIYNKQDLIRNLAQFEEEELVLGIRRNGERIEVAISPVLSENEAQLGIWVRDDTQGVGTLTYLTLDGMFGALGHGISDADSELLMEVSEGKLYDCEIFDITKGKKGTPGKLSGKIIYSSDNLYGDVRGNASGGIYGKGNFHLRESVKNEPIPIALKQEVKEGEAFVLSAVSGELKEYQVKLEKVYNGNNDVNKGMLLTVVDEELLSLTGGIVQGMSGSPIIQDGKLVGAVTHVLVNDPTRGYGIFIENMLDAAE